MCSKKMPVQKFNSLKHLYCACITIIFLFYIPNTFAISYNTVSYGPYSPQDIANLKIGSNLNSTDVVVSFSKSDMSDLKYPLTIEELFWYKTLENPPAQPPHCLSDTPGVEYIFTQDDGQNLTCPPVKTGSFLSFIVKTIAAPVSSVRFTVYKFAVFDVKQLKAGVGYINSGNYKLRIRDADGQWIQDLDGYLNYFNITYFKSSASIYFPDFLNQGSPQVPLRIIPFSGSNSETFAKGEAKLRMCLDDANNINSKEYQLTFTDGSDATKNQFYLRNTSDKDTSLSNQIPYQVWVKNPINRVDEQAQPRQVITWNNITKTTVLPSQVMVNGKAVPCVPAPLTFKVLPFKLSTKKSGIYTSSVDILFTPTLNN